MSLTRRNFLTGQWGRQSRLCAARTVSQATTAPLLSRREALATLLVTTASVLAGCGPKQIPLPKLPPIKPNDVDATLPPDTPDYIKKFMPIARVSYDDEGNKYYEGYTLPPMVYSYGAMAERREVIFKEKVLAKDIDAAEPVATKDPVTGKSSVIVFSSIEQARAYRDIQNEIAEKIKQGKTEKSGDGKTGEEIIPIDTDKIHAFNERVARLKKNTVFDTSILKPPAP